MAKRFTHRLAEDDVQALQAHERRNLRALAGHPPPPAAQTLELDAIAQHGGTQPRVGLDEDTVADYTERMRWDDLEGAIVDPDLQRWDPVTLFFDGQTHWLADGFHRLAAAHRAQIHHIQALVHQGSQRDAVAHSLGANATHGKRRTNQDKRRAVARALEDAQWGAHSDREVARMCRVSQPFVSKLRAELEHAGQLAPTLARQSADGKTIEVDVLRQNRTSPPPKKTTKTPKTPKTPGHALMLDLRGKTAKTPWKTMSAKAEHCPHTFIVLYDAPNWIHLALANQHLESSHTASLCFLHHPQSFAAVWQPKKEAQPLVAAYDSVPALMQRLKEDEDEKEKH